jgi:hypothetical protein
MFSSMMVSASEILVSDRATNSIASNVAIVAMLTKRARTNWNTDEKGVLTKMVRRSFEHSKCPTVR